MDAKERLKEYIEKDEVYQDYKQDKLMNASDFEKFCIQHCRDIDEILEENQELKQKYENAVSDYETTMSEKNELKKQVDYIRSGEYLNQLKFERNMLEEIVEHVEVSQEDKEFIDMTHRNTELLEENEKLKLQLSSTTFCYDEEEHKKLKKQLEEYKVTTEDTKDFVKCLYTGGYISEMTKNNILDRLGD